ncbi:hypothetical protein FAZ78_09910 [Cereibacter changlensis]|uniref:Uncharacterized protein n=1 Tax=Cereibacter changlensis TaxID=402884 RepID=A0A4U0YVH9_9RHOB|nr:hypothetical protein [Cereibacter changlensis]TKA96742.1 hypothetical protein FAZ78_09910 [Cereibacter changlensis]
MTNSELLSPRTEAELLRDAFADRETVIANAIADLFASRQPAEPPRGPLAKAQAAIDAEEAEHGPLAPYDRRRERLVSRASNIPTDVIRHVLVVRENRRRQEQRQASRQV